MNYLLSYLCGVQGHVKLTVGCSSFWRKAKTRNLWSRLPWLRPTVSVWQGLAGAGLHFLPQEQAPGAARMMLRVETLGPAWDPELAGTWKD